LAALGTAAEAGDQEGITKADMWLAHQGAEAVLPCADILQNGTSDAQRVAVTRVLVQVPGGKQALLAATDVDSKIASRVHRVAVEAAAHVIAHAAFGHSLEREFRESERLRAARSSTGGDGSSGRATVALPQVLESP
jgi:hypothetical protein